MSAKAAAVALLLFLGTPAAAANWVKVESKPARTTYVDASSIRVRGYVREAWEKTVETPTGPIDPRRVLVDISRWRYDCARRRSMLLFSEGVLRDGTVVDSGGVPASQRNWDDVLPTSTAAATLRFTCSH